MHLDPLNTAPVIDAQNRFRQDFSDFARLWQETKQDWRDEKARQFEQEFLSPLAPSLTRFSVALAEFTKILRQSQTAIADTDAQKRELY